MKLAAFVTGGGKGIGRTISIALAKSLPVLIIGRTQCHLEETQRLIRDSGGECEYLTIDLLAEDFTAQVKLKLEQLGWEITSFIHNAGFGKSGAFDTFDFKLWKEVQDVNLTSVIPLLQYALGMMRERKKGSVCFISSVSGVKGYTHDTAYIVAKSSQISLMRALAAEYGRYQIQCVALCPHYVESEMTDQSIQNLAERKSISLDEAKAEIEKRVAQRRIISQDEVAEMVTLISSGRVLSLSGEPVFLSGGAL